MGRFLEKSDFVNALIAAAKAEAAADATAHETAEMDIAQAAQVYEGATKLGEDVEDEVVRTPETQKPDAAVGTLEDAVDAAAEADTTVAAPSSETAATNLSSRASATAQLARMMSFQGVTTTRFM